MQGYGTDTEHYVLGGAIIPRPAIPAPEEVTLVAGAEYRLTGVPQGTEVRDEPGGVLGTVGADETLEREWALPGVYLMRLEPPWPWCPRKVRWW